MPEDTTGRDIILGFFILATSISLFLLANVAAVLYLWRHI